MLLFAGGIQFNEIESVLGSIEDTKFCTSEASGRKTEEDSFEDSYSVMESLLVSFKSE